MHRIIFDRTFTFILKRKFIASAIIKATNSSRFHQVKFVFQYFNSLAIGVDYFNAADEVRQIEGDIVEYR